MEKNPPSVEYQKRHKDYEEKSKDLARKLNNISNLRLFEVVLGLAGSVYLYKKDFNLFSAVLVGFTIFIFLCLVFYHGSLKAKKKRWDILCNINHDSTKRINNEWGSFKDTGDGFKDYDHNYSDDLDIFGERSLFQWINTCVTFKGRRILSQWLTKPSESKKEILSRQSAAKELSENLDWRQSFLTEGMLSKEEFQDPEKLIEWAGSFNGFYTNKVLTYVVNFLPLVTLIMLVGAFVWDIPFFVSGILICIQIAMLAFKFIEMSSVLDTLGSYIDNIKAYEKMLETFEKQDFQCDYLNQLKNRLQSKEGKTAFSQIRYLEKILNRMTIRRSELYIVIDILLLWDYRCMIPLENWKRNSGRSLETWLDALGELEALSSIAGLYFDHSDWATPVIYDDENSPRFFGTTVGHPLLPEDRIYNDLRMMRKGNVHIITGSNMSGKSTLLRTVGINLVLAYIGAPVCASELHCSIFDLYTSMRVRDDLGKNISSFYAELLRIKTMIEAARNGRPVFFLLDEIFRGTNSRDRHTGARVLIKQLSQEGAIGYVSTHDIELGDLETESESIRNFHFREYYEEGQLHFDYKLRPGVSNTRNAIYLMKMAGLVL